MALRPPPVPAAKTRNQGDIRVSFLLVTFLWTSKEK
jgi:hypothetical protein